MKPCGLWLEIEGAEIMQYVDRDSAEFDDFGIPQSARPRAFVDVAADGGQGRKFRETVEDLGFSNVAGMDDVCRSAQRGDGFGAKQTVRIGDDADEDAGSQFSSCAGPELFIFSRNLPTLTTARPTVPRPISWLSSRTVTRKV